MSNFDQWRQFICDPNRAGRFLAPVGASMKAAPAAAIDSATFEAFRAGLHSDAERDLPLLAEALDLCSRDYLEFFSEELPGLLDALSNERTHEEEVVGPSLRGNPRWDRTIVGRRSFAILPTQFYSRIPVKSFVLPENQLVRWLVASVLRGVRAISDRTGGRLPPDLRKLQALAEDALDHPWFSEVPPPPELEPHMVICADRQRFPAYHTASSLARRRSRLEGRHPASKWEAAIELLMRGWLEPIDPDDLFELFALVFVLDILERDLGLGPPSEYGLLLGPRRHVAAFKADDPIRVLFDQAPASVLGIMTEFSKLAAAHKGLETSPRRPDIVLIREGAKRRVVFIEVKRTASERYLSDSVYKAFGYMHDFRVVWEMAPGRPKIILFVPERVSPLAHVDLSELELIVAGPDVREALAEAIALGLALKNCFPTRRQ